MNWEKTITIDQEYETFLGRLSKIFEVVTDRAEGMESGFLVTLIDKYEKEHYPISLPDPITAMRDIEKIRA